jgi:hypothetical protein
MRATQTTQLVPADHCTIRPCSYIGVATGPLAHPAISPIVCQTAASAQTKAVAPESRPVDTTFSGTCAGSGGSSPITSPAAPLCEPAFRPVAAAPAICSANKFSIESRSATAWPQRDGRSFARPMQFLCNPIAAPGSRPQQIHHRRTCSGRRPKLDRNTDLALN